MKNPLSVTLLALSLAQCSVGCNKSPTKTNVEVNRSQISGRTVTLKEQGMSFTIPVGWHKDDESIEADHSSFGWRGPGNIRFALSVSMNKPEDKPEWGNRSIEDDTNSFYQDHKRGGSEDVRFFEIDGVKGVHFRNDSDGYDELDQPELHKLIIWDAQRMYNGKRQLIFTNLSGPASSFIKDQDTLYGILNSIKFTQNDSESSASVLTPAETVDESPVIVALPSDDEIYVRKQKVPRAKMATAVDNLLWNLPEEKQIAYIKARSDVTYGVIVGIIDDIRALGYHRIGLVTDKTREKPKTTISPRRATGPSKKDEGERSGAQTTAVLEDQLVVTVETGDAGKITARVGETRVPLRDLASKVRALLKDRANKNVKIVAAGTMHYGSIVEVIDEVKAGGAEAIELGVKSP